MGTASVGEARRSTAGVGELDSVGDSVGLSLGDELAPDVRRDDGVAVAEGTSAPDPAGAGDPVGDAVGARGFAAAWLSGVAAAAAFWRSRVSW
jgi:hypothetical protein